MARIKGRLWGIKEGSDIVYGSGSASISFKNDLIDVTGKDSTDNWAEFIDGKKGGECSFDGLVDLTHSVTVHDLYDDLASGGAVAYVFSPYVAASGDKFWTFNAIPNSLEITADNDGALSCSGSLQITGKPSHDTTA